MQMFDLIIVGGGIMGCAIATYLLKADADLNILIIERDTTYVNSSTVRSDGNIRVQFNIKENIQISLYGLSVLATFADEMATDDHRPAIGFRQQGNLYVVDGAGETSAKEGLALQQSLGGAVEWLEPDQIPQHHPLFHSTNCIGATFGRQDGTMSPLDVLLAYRYKAIELGAHFLEAEVGQLRQRDGQISGVQLVSGNIFHAPIVINAAGAWAARLAKTIGIDLPIQPIKRQIFVVEIEAHFDTILPVLLLPNGQYVFHEGGNLFTVGGKLPNEPITYDDFDWNRKQFEEHLWEGFVEYMPAFDRLKVTNGWAGLYAVNTFDHNAILGEYPPLRGLYLANGFSGHGFQQCHAVGRYLSELVLGVPPDLDLAIFSPQRILDNRPLFENPKRII